MFYWIQCDYCGSYCLISDVTIIEALILEKGSTIGELDICPHCLKHLKNNDMKDDIYEYIEKE